MSSRRTKKPKASKTSVAATAASSKTSASKPPKAPKPQAADPTKLRLQVVSDLHIEFWAHRARLNFITPSAPILVRAGPPSEVPDGVAGLGEPRILLQPQRPRYTSFRAPYYAGVRRQTPRVL